MQVIFKNLREQVLWLILVTLVLSVTIVAFGAMLWAWGHDWRIPIDFNAYGEGIVEMAICTVALIGACGLYLHILFAKEKEGE